MHSGPDKNSPLESWNDLDLFGPIWTDLDRSFNQEYGLNSENIWKYQKIFLAKNCKDHLYKIDIFANMK